MPLTRQGDQREIVFRTVHNMYLIGKAPISSSITQCKVTNVGCLLHRIRSPYELLHQLLTCLYLDRQTQRDNSFFATTRQGITQPFYVSQRHPETPCPRQILGWYGL